ncbi:hypothetical protein SAMN00808754_0531 [Thermanaeromonas toyohensis ToBE]|uniref:TusA-related sulfurtransferase n=1 Tax=Thermanaeromonas toyohensis ToBE TaxID=698762 RepID=A0A1W1VF45_9FIRM|nr:hypothetical protein [Thermanaeromonas toyohensis]SMB91833.1 hypothetical protein SAMN00808754_0531 [Thermanaeromonas toyohensis ToBE]
MADITLWMGPFISQKDVERVQDILPHIGDGDHLTISMEAADAHQADSIIRLLDEYGFNYQSRGDSDGHTYHIVACRRPK